MPKCSKCKFDYPEDYLAPLYTSLGDIQDVCGPCALELLNDIQGIKRTKFDGPESEKLRLKTIKYRKEHEVIQ